MRSGLDIPDATATARASLAVAWRHLYKWISIPSNFLPTFIFPMVFFTAFAGGAAAVREVPGFDYGPGYTSFVFVFSLLQTCTFGGLATGFTIAADFESGLAERAMLSARNRYAILYGYLGSTFVRAALMCVVISVVGMPLGLRFQGNAAETLAVYLIALTLSFVGTLWASGVMFRGRSSQLAPAMQIPMFISIFLAPVYVPYELLEGWIRAVATYNPYTYIMEALRSLIAGSPTGIGTALACIAALIAVLWVWARRGVRAAERAT